MEELFRELLSAPTLEWNSLAKTMQIQHLSWAAHDSKVATATAKAAEEGTTKSTTVEYEVRRASWTAVNGIAIAVLLNIFYCRIPDPLPSNRSSKDWPLQRSQLCRLAQANRSKVEASATGPLMFIVKCMDC